MKSPAKVLFRVSRLQYFNENDWPVLTLFSVPDKEDYPTR